MPSDISDFLDNLSDEPPKKVIPETNPRKDPNDLSLTKEPSGEISFTRFLDQIAKNAQVLPELIDTMKREIDALLSIGDMKSALKQLDRTGNKFIRKAFWDIYLQVFFQHQKKPSDHSLLYYLRYGLVDERLVSPSNLEFLKKKLNPSDPPSGNILPLSTWLKMIYEGKETPSITELGVDFGKSTREKARRMSTKEKAKEEGKTEEEKKRDLIRYEITNMASTVSGIMMMNPSSSILPLVDQQIGKIETSYVTPRAIREAVNEIKQYDFSLFYRESIFHPDSNTSEIVQVEIEPYFVIFPLAGDKVVFWQDVSNGKKSTRGRIFIPAIFLGNFKKSMIHALANFRWELCRSSKGSLWSDPVEGGVTGAFYDYVTFYKRNNKLSFEAKAKLEKTIRNARKDHKKIFLDYYMLWVEYERKGIMKLDKVAREIFFKHVPFVKDVREKLKRIPIYAELINRYNNLSIRNIDRLELKYKKRRDAEGGLPEALQSNLDYYLK